MEDGASLSFRVFIFNVREGMLKPVGPDLTVGYSIVVVVRDSPAEG